MAELDAQWAIVRLGKDSVSDIRLIDESPAGEVDLDVQLLCKQVPQEVGPGTRVLVWLGSDNNKGTATSWRQGLRAKGFVESKSGGPGYNDQWMVSIRLDGVLQESLSTEDLLLASPTNFTRFRALPVIGLLNSANQVVQSIDTSREGTDVEPILRYFDASSSAPRLPVAATGDLSDVVSSFSSSLKSANIDYGERHAELVRRFLASLVTKRFLILTGLSGSGKTKLAQAFGEWIGQGNFEIVPVRPDWTSPDYLLGYQNDLAHPLHDGRQPWEVPATLDLILRAHADPTRPYLLILDEMNLAHVERYFADILSGIESDAPVIPNIDGKAVDSGTKLVKLPSNLFVVGTVNVDETTYMFSPKVLDRANTIEFRVETEDLGRTAQRPTQLEPGASGVVTRFLADSQQPTRIDGAAEYAGWLAELHGLLSETGREFGHRSYTEMMEFRTNYVEAGGQELGALDVQVCQKVLPRIHGTQRDAGPALRTLAQFCHAGPGLRFVDDFDVSGAAESEAQLPLSFDKVRRMAKRLEETHFVSFAE